jgi:DegV family protein with EDD domain
MGVLVITDSTSDVSLEQAREYQLEVVPIWVLFGEERLRDGIDITRANFYDRLAAAKVLPRTEPPEPAVFEAAFARAVESGHEVVAPLISSGVSKTFENAAAAAAKFGSKVRVWDSKTLTGGLFLQAMVAAEMAKAGASSADIMAALERGRGAQHGLLISPDLTYLGRSGRVNKAIVALGTMMKVSPVLQVKNGAVESAAQARSYEKAQELIVDMMARQIGDVTKTRFAIGHTQAPGPAAKLAEALKTKLNLPPKSLVIYEGGPTIAVNSGPGSLAIFSSAGM